jgi:hypothetical protein
VTDEALTRTPGQGQAYRSRARSPAGWSSAVNRVRFSFRRLPAPSRPRDSLPRLCGPERGRPVGEGERRIR